MTCCTYCGEECPCDCCRRIDDVQKITGPQLSWVGGPTAENIGCCMQPKVRKTTTTTTTTTLAWIGDNKIDEICRRRFSYKPPVLCTPDWAFVANDNGYRVFPVPVDLRYGIDGSYLYLYNVTGTYTFNSATFGGDPAPNVSKRGWARCAKPLSPIPTLFNTGVSDDGAVLSLGSTDLHYTITVSPGSITPIPAIVVNPIPEWFVNDTTSNWLSPQSAGIDNIDNQGLYIYQTTFDLTGFEVTTASLTLSFLADNEVMNVFLNDSSTNIHGDDPAHYGWSPEFQITTDFVPGLNTLTFNVSNTTEGPSPTGFRLRISGVAMLST